MLNINNSIDEFIKALENGERRNVLLYHHYDSDGHGPVVLLNVLRDTFRFGLYCKCCPKTADIVKDDIESGFTDKFTDIFIVDLSVSNGEIADMLGGLDKHVVLVDHHKTAEWLNDYPYVHVVVHDIDEGIIECGTSLFYKYLTPLFNSKQVFSVVQEAAERYVNLVTDWDTFNWKRSEHGLEAFELNMIFKSKSHKTFVQDMVKNILSDYIFSKEDEIIINVINNTINTQTFIFNKNAVFTTIMIENRELNIAFGFCENYYSEVGDWVNSNYPDIDITIMVSMLTGAVSMRSNKIDVDLSAIAKSLGGGGHRLSSGFPLESVLDIDVTSIILNNIMKKNNDETFKQHELKFEKLETKKPKIEEV